MRTNRKDVGHTYNAATGCTPGKGKSGCSGAECHTNVRSCIQSRDAAGDVPEWHALSHSIHTPCAASRKHSTHGSANGFKLAVD